MKHPDFLIAPVVHGRSARHAGLVCAVGRDETPRPARVVKHAGATSA